jgi:hypothetical protein
MATKMSKMSSRVTSNKTGKRTNMHPLATTTCFGLDNQQQVQR